METRVRKSLSGIIVTHTKVQALMEVMMVTLRLTHPTQTTRTIVQAQTPTPTALRTMILTITIITEMVTAIPNRVMESTPETQKSHKNQEKKSRRIMEALAKTTKDMEWVEI